MMGDDEQIDRSDRIVRAHQLEFLVPGEVAEMRDAELAKRHDAADRLRVLGWIGILRLEGRARGVRAAAAREWRLLHGSGRAHDAPVEPCDRNRIARFCN